MVEIKLSKFIKRRRIMRLKLWTAICLLIGMTLFSLSDASIFIAKRENLQKYYGRQDIVMIASAGRSGSTMLTKQVEEYLSPHNVLKTHLLTPDRRFKGKIIFIFSNPDQAAESALFRILHGNRFGDEHFSHVETADRAWLKRIGGPFNQTEQDNLLSYDALGTYEHLKEWLYHRTEPASLEHAQIMAVKYENLWDQATIRAMRKFLNISHFELPPKEERGHKAEELLPQEIAFRKIYNVGTPDNPRYAAYDEARVLWEQAPPFQFLKISRHRH
jgi:hypothetical protein